MLPRDATFVVVDTETTGGQPRDSRLIEVAAVRVERGMVVDRMSYLVNPGVLIPRRITELTGISTPMVLDAPPVRVALEALHDFRRDDILVAHNLTFDLGFLNAESERSGVPRFEGEMLCSLKLARRVLPGLPSKGLSALAEHYQVRVQGRHRALGDAEATAVILLKLLQHAEYRYGVTDLPRLFALQGRQAPASRAPKHPLQATLDRLPASPGVYFFRDAEGVLLYVGKAKRLRDRVRTYFSGLDRHPARLRQMVLAIKEVTWKETETELEALLEESYAIKQMQPRYNRALRRYRNRPFLRIDVQHPAPDVSLVPYLEEDGAAYFGPLSGRTDAELLLETIRHLFRLRPCDATTFRRGELCIYHEMGQCDGPCALNVNDAYREEVQALAAFLAGLDVRRLDRLREAMATAAQERRYEDAARLRDLVQASERLVVKQHLLSAPILEQHVAVVAPSHERGRVQVLAIRKGRLAGTLTVSTTPTEDEHAALLDFAQQSITPDSKPSRYMKREVEEVRLVLHWLYANRDAIRILPIDAAEPAERLALRLAVAACQVPQGGAAEELDAEDLWTDEES